MSLLTLIKSASRVWPARCLMVVAFAITTPALMAQSQSQLSCQGIAIFGAVKMPGRFEIPARMRLLGALAIAGGPSERAGKIVKVVHSCQCSPCAESEVRTATITEYNLSATLAGREDANPLLGAGDIIIVREAEMIFVVGNDFSKRVVYREGLRLTQAIAGGVARYSDLVRVRIQRNPVAGPRPAPFILSLKAVLDHQSEDPVLEPRDIIEISDEAGNFQSRLKPIFGDPPLRHPDKEPPLVKRKSSSS